MIILKGIFLKVKEDIGYDEIKIRGLKMCSFSELDGWYFVQLVFCNIFFCFGFRYLFSIFYVFFIVLSITENKNKIVYYNIL